MSKIFYDHLIVLEEIKIHIDKVTKSPEEKEELWQLVDEIIHHRILTSILGKLPEEHHQDFLNKFYKSPHDESLISYLNEKINEDVEIFIKNEADLLSNELLQLMGGKKKK